MTLIYNSTKWARTRGHCVHVVADSPSFCTQLHNYISFRVGRSSWVQSVSQSREMCSTYNDDGPCPFHLVTHISLPLLSLLLAILSLAPVITRLFLY